MLDELSCGSPFRRQGGPAARNEEIGDETLTISGDFEPAWWCPGAHLQTVWGRLLRRRVAVPTCRVRWTTPDGDFLDLDFMDGPVNSPFLLVLHGLEGSSNRKYVRGLLRLARKRGWRGVALNFRSCSGSMNRAPRLYHSGETADLDWVVAELTKREPGAVILPVGFSLGGNVLLKWLGEEGDGAPDEVRAAVAISTPFDLAAAARKMSRGIGKLYSRFFFRSLKAKALAKAMQYPDLLDRRAIKKVRNWKDYDGVVTAPLHGFESAEDYWARSSSASFLAKIRRPVFLISSADDPFTPHTSLPHEPVSESPWLDASFTERGGHVGFVGGAFPWSSVSWAEQRAIEFLSGFVPTLPPMPTPPHPWNAE